MALKKYGSDELHAIQMECMKNAGPDNVSRWLDEQGIEEDAFFEYADSAAAAAAMLMSMVAKATEDAGVEEQTKAVRDVIASTFKAGVEFGIRIRQSREVVV